LEGHSASFLLQEFQKILALKTVRTGVNRESLAD